MDCRSCSLYSGDPAGTAALMQALKGQPIEGMQRLTTQEILQVACALARVGSLLCDIGDVGAAPGARAVDQPYIWDTED